MARLKAEIELENKILRKEIDFKKREIELLKEIIERGDNSRKIINNLIDDLDKMDEHIITINKNLKVFNENNQKNVELILEKFAEKFLDDELLDLEEEMEELKLDDELDELDELELDD